jgi:hypothetical protein
MVLLEDAHEMLNIVLVGVLHAKVIDDKGEAIGHQSWCQYLGVILL